MDIRIMEPIGKSGVLHSLDAECGARRLLERLEEDTMRMEILPENDEQFTGRLEEKDYVSYLDFLGSSDGRKVLDILEEDDAGQLFKL